MLSGCRGSRTKSRKKAQMACCSGKSVNIRGTDSSDDEDCLTKIAGVLAPVLTAGHVAVRGTSSDDAEAGGVGSFWASCFFFCAFRRTALV